MALEPVFARGCMGDIVRDLQLALAKQKVPIPGKPGKTEVAWSRVDGSFGPGMQRAVERVQARDGLPMTGVVDAATWKLLMGPASWPDHFTRLVGVCSGSEGHGYTIAAGNGDGAGITWGIVGFALVTNNGLGTLAVVLRSIYRKQKDAFEAAFGQKKFKAIVAALKLDSTDKPTLDRSKLLEFAKPLSAPGGNRLVEDWQEAFKTLGSNVDVQEIQRDEAKSIFYDKSQAKAKSFADDYDMGCERTDLFFLDLWINNGRLTDDEELLARNRIQKIVDADHDAPLLPKLTAVIDVLVASRKRIYTDIIRRRKSTIAYGYGLVDETKFFRIDGWGIDVSEPGGGAPPLSHASVVLDGTSGEAIALAAACKTLGLAEEPAAAALTGFERLPAGTGIEIATSPMGRAVVIPGLSTVGAPNINARQTQVYYGLHVLFRGRPGLLSISGQAVYSPGAGHDADVVVLQRSKKTWAGIVLNTDDQLLVLRQRERKGQDPDESSVNITDVRRNLSSVRLLLLYLSLGVPQGKQRGSGPRWRQWLKPVGADPIVLGWFGAIRPPSGEEKKTLADRLLSKLKVLEPAADFETLCTKYEGRIVDLWGQSCHEVFAKGEQSYLWHGQLLQGPEIAQSGAAAIDRTGQVWVANPKYGEPGQAIMIKGK